MSDSYFEKLYRHIEGLPHIYLYNPDEVSHMLAYVYLWIKKTAQSRGNSFVLSRKGVHFQEDRGIFQSEPYLRTATLMSEEERLARQESMFISGCKTLRTMLKKDEVIRQYARITKITPDEMVCRILNENEQLPPMKLPITPYSMVHLFPRMREELLSILQSLSDEEWQNPTACENWSVKDVALHILADDIGYLSRHRDDDGITFSTDSWDELVERVNKQNAIWVQATRRMSRRLLMSFLELTGNLFFEYLVLVEQKIQEGGDYETHPVSWAGTQNAPMWLQITREYTEYWMHHQHICEAVNRVSLKEGQFLRPVLKTFVHALPRAYADVNSPEETVICFKIESEQLKDSWYLIRENDTWNLYADTDLPPDCTVRMSEDTAWRLFTKGIKRSDAEAKATITGNQELGRVLLDAVAIIA